MSDPTPPGQVSEIVASDALVIAPHYDDEVLGCGGLLARLAAEGTRIRVLFLSDASEGLADAEARRLRSRLRREESRGALAVLGVSPESTEHLGLPDGRLGEQIPALQGALAEALEASPADLVLCPSPLEASRDHRAAFAALHGVLSEIRPGHPQEQRMERLRVLLYEINRPGYPDTLIDVGEQLEPLERAIRCFASQLEQHDYLEAALGLRRYRTLSLAPEIAAAEGYRSLSHSDFVTRSLEGLIRELGGVPEIVTVTTGPLISAVIRTRDRPELLEQALASVAASAYTRLEVVVVNDGGASPSTPDPFPFPLRLSSHESSRGRAAAAQTGVELATGDVVSFLDDDDLVDPEHYAALAGALGGAGIRVAYSDAAVGVYEPSSEGWSCVERRLPYSRSFDADRLLLDNYIPLHTLAIERALFGEVGPFDLDLPFFEDWDFLIRLAQLTPFHHLARVTCEYRHFRGGGHHILGNDPRSRSDFLLMKARLYQKHRELMSPELLARAVDELRTEAVQQRESASWARSQLRESEVSSHRQRGEIASLGGEIASLRGELAGARGELEMVRGDRDRADHELRERHAVEKELRGGLDEQAAEIERLYGEERRLLGEKGGLEELAEARGGEIGKLYEEIRRLEDLLETMRSSRAWRLATWWRRWRS